MTHSIKSKPKPKPSPSLNFEFLATGTKWSVEIYEPLSEAKFIKLQASIKKRVAEFEKNYSRFRDDSMVSHIASKAGVYSLPADAKLMLDIYKDLYEISSGLMTPLVGQLLSDAGYDKNYSFKSKKLHKLPAWDEVLNYDYPLLTVLQPVLLDFGAAGKGYLVDIIGSLLKKEGLLAFCVDAGGDMLYKNILRQPLRVGLEHPDNPGQVIGVAEILNQSICGSSGNRRAWEGYNHILDPSQLVSPKHIKALWVIASSALIADALATALFFVPPAELNKRYNFEYAIISQDLSLQYSKGFRAEFFEK